MKTTTHTLLAGAILLALAATAPAADTVVTAVYSRIGNGYKRAKAKDGSFKPEYYALSNGGRIEGTGSDVTIDRVTYPEVAEVAQRLLAGRGYHYAQTKEQASLLVVLQWGLTLAPDNTAKEQNVAAAQTAATTVILRKEDLVEKLLLDNSSLSRGQAEDIAKNTAAGFGPAVTDPAYMNEHAAVAAAGGAFEGQMLQTLVDNRVRDELNLRNARILGYMDDLAGADDIRRYAGGGDLYNDLRADVEEARYYIVVSAYDFKELLKTQKRKLLWQTRVSVRSPGNSFNDSYLAMLRSASIHFGQNSGKLVRNEEAKGTVELGDLKFLGEARGKTEPSPDKKTSK